MTYMSPFWSPVFVDRGVLVAQRGARLAEVDSLSARHHLAHMRLARAAAQALLL